MKDKDGSYDAYLRNKAEPQLRELLTNYGPMCLIWFDTPQMMTGDRPKRLTDIVRTLQPSCLIDGRLGAVGDYVSTGDNAIPNSHLDGAWEVPATLNRTWGYRTDDHDWKSPGELVFKLVDIVSKGGNYLLNVGPTAEGVVPQPSQDNLRAVGEWLKTNGEAVYGAGRSPFGEEFGDYAATQKGLDGIIAIFVLVLVVFFWRAKLPEIKPEDAYHTDESGPAAQADKAAHKGLAFALMLAGAGVIVFSLYAILTYVMEIAVPAWAFLVPLALGAVWLWNYSQRLTTHHIWAHPHFSGATLAQFLYVAAQAGIFSFFINYMISELPAISEGLRTNGVVAWFLKDGFGQTSGTWHLTDVGASRMLSVGFFLFFIGRVIGAAILRKTSAHLALGTYAFINLVLCGIVVLKLGWLSVAAVFGTFFFMSIMFPTIFALGIFGLGPDSKKKASAFIVMSITGGALMPKLMGRLGDLYNMSVSFLMPLVCFLLIALYGFAWSKLSRSDGVVGLDARKGH